MPSDTAKLEETISILQEEIAILVRHVNPNEKGLLEAERERRAAAAAVARQRYSNAQEVRDLQEMVEILERRKAALVIQEKDYRNRFPISNNEP